MQQYIVEPNDTFFQIAKEFKIPLAQLIRANPQITNPSLIYPGQTIIIPDLIPIPRQLDIIGSNAEDVIDDIFVSNWLDARSRISIIKESMIELIPELQQALVPKQLISGLNLAINSLDQNAMQERAFSAISQANRITQIMADILDYFEVIIPSDIYRLAFFARQMIVNVEQNDWNEAYNNYARLRTVWDRLSPELGAEFSDDIVEFNQMLNNLQGSITRRGYQSTINVANEILGASYAIGTVFDEQNR